MEVKPRPSEILAELWSNPGAKNVAMRFTLLCDAQNIQGQLKVGHRPDRIAHRCLSAEPECAAAVNA
jgi:hypothetical protein